MNHHDIDTPAELTALRGALDGVTMDTPVEEIVTAGRVRRRHRRVAGVATAVLAASAVAAGVTTFANPPTAPPQMQSVGWTVDRNADGTVKVTWDKRRYFADRTGLEAALRAAGFPVLIREGEFCAGPQDDTRLDPSGTGPGVDRVVRSRSEANGRVTFVFDAARMPAGKQLFIGYLNAAQLAVTHGAPGSVERLISTGVPLTCTTVAPPPHVRTGGGPAAPQDKPGR